MSSFSASCRLWARRSVGALLSALALQTAVAAVEPVRLQGCQRIELDGRHLDVAIDPGSRMSVLDSQHAEFAPASGHLLNFGVRKGTVWLRFSVLGGGCDSPLFLQLGNPFVNRVLIYREADPGEWVVDWAAETGRDTAVQPRLRHAVLPIQARQEQRTNFIVEITGPGAIVLAPTIIANTELSWQTGERMLLGGVLAGGILALAVYCACLALLTRIKGLLAYSVSALAYGVFYANAGGLLDRAVLWLMPAGQDPFDAVMRLHGFAVVTSALFHWFFITGLLSERTAPMHHRPAVQLALAGWAALLLAIPLLPGATLSIVCMSVALVAIGAIVREVRRALRQRHPLGRVIAVAFGALALSTVAFMAMYLGMIPWHQGPLHLLALGAWFESILLSMAVGAQVKALRGEQQQLTARTRELSLLSQLDALTGLGNRRAYDAVVPAEIDRCLRRGRTASLLVVDIDHFKRVNDTYGHVFGDSVIRTLGTTIANCVRSSDFAFRYGGEEFVVLLPGLDAAMACEVAERIMSEFSQCGPTAPDGSRPQCTVSIGLAQLRADDQAHLLFERADAAMYRAKQNGRARTELADGLAPRPRAAAPA